VRTRRPHRFALPQPSSAGHLRVPTSAGTKAGAAANHADIASWNELASLDSARPQARSARRCGTDCSRRRSRPGAGGLRETRSCVGAVISRSASAPLVCAESTFVAQAHPPADAFGAPARPRAPGVVAVSATNDPCDRRSGVNVIDFAFSRGAREAGAGGRIQPRAAVLRWRWTFVESAGCS
jgi:hypothetical protein